MKRLRIDPIVNNSDFVITLKIMQDNPNPDTQKDFINQMLHTKFLCPALFDPDPELSDDESKIASLPDDAKVMLSSLSNSKGEIYLVAYTDNQEAARHKQAENQHAIECSYFDFCTMVLKEKSPYAGFVINPFSENVIVTKEIIQNINKNIRIKRQVEIPREDNRRKN